MRWSEITETQSKPLFWGTRQEFPLGQVIIGRKINHDDRESKWVEKVFEQYRHAQFLNRNLSVYMVDQPDPDLIEKAGGYADHIYQMIPQGKVERNDVHWWSQVYHFALDFQHTQPGPERAAILKQVEPLVLNYFAGTASDHPNWEYRVRKAVIEKKVR